MWYTPDPLGFRFSSNSFYVYAASSPISKIDSNGLSPTCKTTPVMDSEACYCFECHGGLVGANQFLPPSRQLLGLNICNNGTIIPCNFYHGPSNVVSECIDEHEDVHAYGIQLPILLGGGIIGQAIFGPCDHDDSDLTTVNELNYNYTECWAHIMQYACMKKNCPKESVGADACNDQMKNICRSGKTLFNGFGVPKWLWKC